MIETRPKTIRVVLHQYWDAGDLSPTEEFTAETVWPVGFPLPRRDDAIEVGDVQGTIQRVVWRLLEGEPFLHIEVIG